MNAGHLPPLLVRRGRLGKMEVERLHEGGPVLGLLPFARYSQGEAKVEPGDLLVMYSDGILEAQNERDEEFGEDRILQVICQNQDKAPGEICAAILNSVRGFLGRQTAHDDQTLLVVRLEPVNRRQQIPVFEGARAVKMC